MPVNAGSEVTLLYAENEIQKHTSRMKGVKYVQGEDDEKPRLVKIKRPKRAPFGSAGNRFKASPPSYELLPASDNSRNYLGMVDFELNLPRSAPAWWHCPDVVTWEAGG